MIFQSSRLAQLSMYNYFFKTSYLAAYVAMNPLGIFTDSSVNRVIPRMTAPITLTDHALQEPSATPILTHDWSTTVGVACLNGARVAVPCAEHGVCYRNTSIFVVVLAL